MHRRAVLLGAVGVAIAGSADAAANASAFRVNSLLLLRAYQSFVEEHLSGLLRAMRAVARTADAQSGEWGRVRAALFELGEQSPTYATAWFAPADGSYYTIATDGPSGLNLSDRAYFTELLAGHDVEGDLVTSKLSGRPSIIVATPIMAGGRVVGAIGAAIDGAMLSELVATSTGLPQNLTFYAVDSAGITAIHKDVKLLGVKMGELGSPTLKRAISRMVSEPSGVARYDFVGTHRTAVFNRSYVTKWTFALTSIRGA